MSLLPAIPGAQPVSPEYESEEKRREEFDRLSLAIRKHNSKEELMDNLTYQNALRRAIDLATSFNQTTAGPKAKPKKTGIGKPQPLSLADL